MELQRNPAVKLSEPLSQRVRGLHQPRVRRDFIPPYGAQRSARAILGPPPPRRMRRCPAYAIMRRVMELRIETMSARDWPRVRAIYREGIDTGDATFEAAPPGSCEAWCADHVPRCTLIARQGEHVCGWIALTPGSGRCVYGGVAELSVYVARERRGRGVGAALLDGVIAASEAEGIWSLQAGVFPENTASLRLLERRGFRVVGRRERLGRMSYGRYAGRWRDVILLERRSSRVGAD